MKLNQFAVYRVDQPVSYTHLDVYKRQNTTYGNRNYLWDVNNVTSGSGGNGMSLSLIHI